jgi:hypothetical protein
MAKLEIMNNASRAFHKFGLKLKKYSPEILVGAGIVGTVAGTVMACKATLKVDTIAEEAKEKIEKIHEATEKGEIVVSVDYTEDGERVETVDKYTAEDSKKDLTIVYTQTAIKFIRLYGPAVLVAGSGIASILTGHNILRKRYVATAAAYAAVDKSFKEYRGRVIDRFGKELDRELKYNLKTKEVEETVVNEDGTETVVKKNIQVVDDNSDISEYAFFYADGCTGWCKDPELNKVFLLQQQAYANDLLKRKGHLFLNEVHDMLGVARTAAGCVVGWIYDEECPNGDNYIDFGIFNIHRKANQRFVNGWENTILLDPNVDGKIQHLI